jgi:Rrf2 family transcriptional regulator, iron-sulfur cluster assembly transcription factor
MKLMLSSSCEYGIRATLYLASLNRDDFVSIGHISEQLDISFHFLTKTFQKLTQAGLMESQRGPSGGVRLKRPASEITLKDVAKTQWWWD